MKSTHVLSGTVALILGTVLSGCQPTPPAPDPGKLSVTVTGLPAGTNAKVSVSGPSNYKTDLSASKTLEGLAAGDYNVSATNVVVSSDTFSGAATPPTVAVKSGETTTSTVTYTKLPVPVNTGKFSVTVTGLPAGTNAQISVSGPSNYKTDLSASKTLEGLALGSYTISAVNVMVAGTSYPATVTPTTVEVKKDATSSVTVVYKNPNLTFASYDGKPELLTAQGGRLFNYVYSEQANAVSISAIVKTPISFSSDYTLPSSGTNAYAGATVVVEGKPNSPAPATDVSGFSKIRIQLASSAATSLQIKLAGSDNTVLNNGCYPVAVVPVTSTLTAIVLDLNDATFALRGYCLGLSESERKTLPQTLPDLIRVEVEDNVLTAASKSSKTTVGTIEFLK